MADEQAAPERPVLAKAKGEFHVSLSARELLNGNKIHLVLECPYDVETMQELAPLHGKDATISFKELATQLSKKEKKAKQLTFGGEEEEEEGIPPE